MNDEIVKGTFLYMLSDEQINNVLERYQNCSNTVVTIEDLLEGYRELDPLRRSLHSDLFKKHVIPKISEILDLSVRRKILDANAYSSSEVKNILSEYRQRIDSQQMKVIIIVDKNLLDRTFIVSFHHKKEDTLKLRLLL